MRKRKGFTLLELLIVVVIIGVLATFAIPQFLKATERARYGKAQNTLSLISQGVKMYYADTGDFTNNIQELDAYVEIYNQQNADKDWTYSVNGSAAASYTVEATRSGGSYNGDNVTLSQDNVWGGNFANNLK